MFAKKVRETEIEGKRFNSSNNKIDSENEYGKMVFARKVVAAKQGQIDFSGFEKVMEGFEKVIEHYKNRKKELGGKGR